MNREEREHLTDRWLDAALKQYGKAEPSAGLEAHILAALAAKQKEHLPFPVSRSPYPAGISRVRRTSLFVAAAALLIAVAGIGVLRFQKTPPSKQVAGINAGPYSLRNETAKQAVATATDLPRLAPSQTAAVMHDMDASAVAASESAGSTETTVAKTRKLAAKESPRRDQFPSPMQLTDEERLLLTYLRTTPKEEILLVAQRQAEQEKEFQEPTTSPTAGPISKGID